MVARRELRRRAFDEAFFERVPGEHRPHPESGPPADDCDFRGWELNGQRFEIRVPGYAQNDWQPEDILVKLLDGDDEPMISPYFIAVLDDPAVLGMLHEFQNDFTFPFEPAPAAEPTSDGCTEGLIDDEPEPSCDCDEPVPVCVDGPRTIRYGRPPVSRRDMPAATIELLALLSALNSHFESDEPVAVPVYGFLASQRPHPAEDVEMSPTLVSISASKSAVRVTVVDSGIASNAWTANGTLNIGSADADGLTTAVAPLGNPPYLGYAAGHGTFIAGVLHQRAPGVKVDVFKAFNPDGVLNENAVTAIISSITAGTRARPDVLLLCFGGYVVRSGKFGISQANQPYGLVPALIRQALVDLAVKYPGSMVVASAGNDNTGDLCYPAAFSQDAALASRVVAVTALDATGQLASFANFGPWVTACTLGQRIRSIYVSGTESPASEQDGQPETFAAPSYAQWSGTSFAAPIVAGAIAQYMINRLGKGTQVTAFAAWAAVLNASSVATANQPCGVHVAHGSVAHA